MVKFCVGVAHGEPELERCVTDRTPYAGSFIAHRLNKNYDEKVVESLC